MRIVTRQPTDIFANTEFLKNYEYNFQASLFPENARFKDPWSLVVDNRYDRFTDSLRLFEMPIGNEHGYATDGKDSIFIQSIYVKKALSKNGKEVSIPVKMLGGYELRWEGGVVCIIDAMQRNVWMYNDLTADEKFILAVISSAILLRRVQDIRQ